MAVQWMGFAVHFLCTAELNEKFCPAWTVDGNQTLVAIRDLTLATKTRRDSSGQQRTTNHAKKGLNNHVPKKLEQDRTFGKPHDVVDVIFIGKVAMYDNLWQHIVKIRAREL